MLFEFCDNLFHAFHIAVVLVKESSVGLEPFPVELLLGFLSGQVSDFGPLFLDVLDLSFGEKGSRNGWPNDGSYYYTMVVVNGEKEQNYVSDSRVYKSQKFFSIPD